MNKYTKILIGIFLSSSICLMTAEPSLAAHSKHKTLSHRLKAKHKHKQSIRATRSLASKKVSCKSGSCKRKGEHRAHLKKHQREDDRDKKTKRKKLKSVSWSYHAPENPSFMKRRQTLARRTKHVNNDSSAFSFLGHEDKGLYRVKGDPVLD